MFVKCLNGKSQFNCYRHRSSRTGHALTARPRRPYFAVKTPSIKMKKKSLALVMALGIVSSANGLTVRLSLDGVNPAPDALDVFAGQVLTMYVISDIDGVNYWEGLTAWTPAPIRVDSPDNICSTGTKYV